MIQELQLRILPEQAANEQSIKLYVSREKGFDARTIKAVRTLKRSIDARQRTIYVNLTVRLYINELPTDDEYTETYYPMVDEGHEVGNHTVNHPSMPSCSDEELEKEVLDLDRKFYEEYGKSMKYLRPPMGEFSERTLSITKSLGYTNVFWSFAYRDWETDKQRGKDIWLDY